MAERDAKLTTAEASLLRHYRQLEAADKRRVGRFISALLGEQE